MLPVSGGVRPIGMERKKLLQKEAGPASRNPP